MIYVVEDDADILSYNWAALRLLEMQEAPQGSVLALNRTKGFHSAFLFFIDRWKNLL